MAKYTKAQAKRACTAIVSKMTTMYMSGHCSLGELADVDKVARKVMNRLKK
jgi:hypothetical protein